MGRSLHEHMALDHGIGIQIAVQRHRELRLTGRSFPPLPVYPIVLLHSSAMVLYYSHPKGKLYKGGENVYSTINQTHHVLLSGASPAGGGVHDD